MTEQLRQQLRTHLEHGRADIETALKVAVLLAAGHRTADIQRRLDLTPKQAKDAIRRVRDATQDLEPLGPQG